MPVSFAIKLGVLRDSRIAAFWSLVVMGILVENRFVVRQSVSTSLRPVPILPPLHRLLLFRRLLFLALVLIFLAAFVAHCMILSYCTSSFE